MRQGIQVTDVTSKEGKEGRREAMEIHGEEE